MSRSIEQIQKEFLKLRESHHERIGVLENGEELDGSEIWEDFEKALSMLKELLTDPNNKESDE